MFVFQPGTGHAGIRVLGLFFQVSETQRQEKFLLNEGCDMMQGYRYARTLHLTDFMAYLEENTRLQSKGTRPNLFVLDARQNG